MGGRVPEVDQDKEDTELEGNELLLDQEHMVVHMHRWQGPFPRVHKEVVPVRPWEVLVHLVHYMIFPDDHSHTAAAKPALGRSTVLDWEEVALGRGLHIVVVHRKVAVGDIGMEGMAAVRSSDGSLQQTWQQEHDYEEEHVRGPIVAVVEGSCQQGDGSRHREERCVMDKAVPGIRSA